MAGLCLAAFLLVPSAAHGVRCERDRCHAVPVPQTLGGGVAPGPGQSVWLAGRGRLVRVGLHGGRRSVRAPVSAGADVAPAGGGAAWFSALGDGIGHVSARGQVSVVPGNAGRVAAIAGAPDGGAWFLAAGGVGHVDPSGGVSVVAPPGRPALRRHALAVGDDGTPWFLLEGGGIGHVRPGGRGEAFDVGGGLVSVGLRAITAGPDGGMWFTSPGARRVGRIGPNGSVASFRLSQRPFDITSGPSGSVWVTMGGGRRWSIVRLTPSGFATFFQVRGRVRGIGLAPGGVAIAGQGAVQRLAPFLGARPIRSALVSRRGAVSLRLFCPKYDLIFCAGTIVLRHRGRVLGTGPFSQRVNDAPATRLLLSPTGRRVVGHGRTLRAIAVIEQHDQGGARRRSVRVVRLRCCT
jgi:virginiamycin B lyase